LRGLWSVHIKIPSKLKDQFKKKGGKGRSLRKKKGINWESKYIALKHGLVGSLERVSV